MSLLFFDSCNDHATVIGPEWGGGGTANQTGRTGDANGAFGPTAFSDHTLTLPSSASTFVMGFGWKLAGYGLSGNGDNVFGIQVAAAGTQLVLYPNTAGLIEARLGSNAGALVATATVPMALNNWYHVQIKAVMHLTAGSLVVKINGVTAINFTGKTSNVTGPVAGVLLHGGNVAVWHYDDIWVCDGVDATATEGRPNNDFLGDLKVAQLLPSGAGAATGWTPNTAVANYTAVDEVPPNATDWVAATASGTRDLYAMSDLAANTGAVYGVRVLPYAMKTDAGTMSIKPVLREAGGLVTPGAAVGAPVAYGPTYGPPVKVRPSDGGVWTAADVNGLQAGVEVA